MSDTNLTERVFVALRDDLMSGRISPAERLSETVLAERYAVSRTPVREALARLLADGLVERRERGLFPYRPSLDDLAQLYELRTTVELRGIVRIEEDDALRHDPDILGPELDRWAALHAAPPEPDAGFVADDERFHDRLLAAAGNRALVSALALVNVRIRPVRMYDYLTEDRIAATITEHIDIAQRVLDRDLAGARAALLAHIDTSRRVAIERASQAVSMAGIISALRT
ncbi:GntR family transcriptional regulator [Nocardia puris]|uniref:GntR family transcriptional regulator n=1 Tax=Nocardia puris TaxID=208602 RepID=A0A366DYU4_9NOCA|nr:GntR family transcriptional regulator [Nocardia puris]MBF6209893.1 GntR family transcriptional regulator [Nocardia puris]MBF6366465.1 GntR family transcriptional regulator [Nocardia puris]MBF6458196.1 GntR family transcriptional regulator [Nocardia puris]RBO94368.1 GntR family transcriptional regulator [Nocardia puris]